MPTYLIDLQERIEAKNEDEAILKFRKIVKESEASIFDVDIVED